MGISFSKEKEAGATGKRKITITASPAACTGLAVVSLLCFVWVFVFGLIVGRGYQPEEAVPELKQFMPTARQNGSVQPSAAGQQDTPVAQQVIKAEELGFFEQLKKDPAPAARPVKQAAPARPATPPAKPVVKPAVEPAKPAVQATAVETASDSGKGEVFNYVYQVAASQDLDAAVRLKARIEASGLKSRIESARSNGATWHRVQVLFRGTPEDTRDLKSTLQSMGISKPMLKEKIAQ
jgi:cell division protein FtsN